MRPLYIREDKIASIEEAVRSLERRANRLGVPAPALVVDPRECFSTTGARRVRAILYIPADVALAGHRVLARVDHEEGSGPIVTAFPWAEGLRFDRSDLRRCEHCGTDRRRVVTYVVEAPDGARLVVGSTCLPDLTGMGRSAVALAEYLASLADFILGLSSGDDGGGDVVRVRGLNLASALTVAAALIEQDGWRPAAQQPSTRQAVEAYLLAKRPEDARKILEKPTERRHRAIALRSIHWARQQGGSEYLDNLAAVCGSAYVWRHLGLAVSAVAAWQRHRGDLKLAAEGFQATGATFPPGGRVRGVEVQVQATHTFDGQYGARTLVKLLTRDGCALTWFCSGAAPDGFERGAILRVDLTPAELSTYRGETSRIVKRVSPSVERKASRKRNKQAELAVE